MKPPFHKRVPPSFLCPLLGLHWGQAGSTLRARSLRGRGKWLLDLSRTSAPWGGVWSRESPPHPLHLWAMWATGKELDWGEGGNYPRVCLPREEDHVLPLQPWLAGASGSLVWA